MKLRLRLAATVVAVAVPILIAMVWRDARTRRAAAEDALARFTLSVLSKPDAQARCEADSTAFQRDPFGRRDGASAEQDAPKPPTNRSGFRRPEFFPYNLDGGTSIDNAPNIGRSGATLEAGALTRRTQGFYPDTVEILVRTPWGSGACALVLARGGTDPWLGDALPSAAVWIVPLVGVIGALLIALGPLVRRVRRLTEAVERSAKAGYGGNIPVEGSDEITTLARAFASADAEVRTQLHEKDRRDQALREFIANTTHDVMIPLTVLQGHLADSQRAAAVGTPVDADALASAMNESAYLGSLLHNLAATARLDQAEPELHLSPVDVGALAIRVVARHKPVARPLGVDLEVAPPEEPLRFLGDETLLEQAVSNLVHNAVRHNQRGGHVAVIVEPVGTDRVRLRVLDDGPGIAPDELSRLTERGYRGGEARTRAPGGQGLGLHIAWRIAALLGLDLRFEAVSDDEGGLQVTLEGPRHS